MTSPMPSGQTSLLLQMTQRLALSDAHFRRICQLIYQRAGIVLADHKRDMVYNRLVRRLRTLGLDDFGRYLSMLEANQNSAEELSRWRRPLHRWIRLRSRTPHWWKRRRRLPISWQTRRITLPGWSPYLM